MDVLFILHADHEQNCGTTAMRVDRLEPRRPVFVRGRGCRARSTARCTAAPTRRSCGCSTDIGSIDNVPAFIESVKHGDGRLMGFGHRVYKNYDPRATIIKQAAYDVFEVTGKNPLLDIALTLEEVGARRLVLRRPQALPERRLLLRADLPGARVPGRHVHRAVRHPPHRRAGSRTGRNCSTTRTRRSAARASGTPAPTSATTSASATAERGARAFQSVASVALKVWLGRITALASSGSIE